MKAAPAPETLLEVDALRIGMFIQLDGGWMSHPFAVSQFRIVSAEQIATIRSLGLARVRWSREQSDPSVQQLPDAPAAGEPAERKSRIDGDRRLASADEATTQAAVPVVYPAVTGGIAGAEPRPTDLDAAVLPLSANPGGDVGADRVGRQTPRDRLIAEAAALQLCERQFAEAAADCRRLTDLATSQPQEARSQAEALTGALAAKMLVGGELCIRLLTDASGDKSAVHALNVTIVSMLMGRSFGLPEAELLDLGTGALLHDIGKLKLPERVCHPDKRFSSADTRLYEEHVSQGVAFARRMGLSPGATLVIAQHHEQSNGDGFPLRLAGERMTPAARIVALVNRYDRLCNPFQPGEALTPHESLSLLFAQGQTMFDTAILCAFVKMMGVYPAGSTVQLTDDRFAIVVSVNSARPLRPRVLVHDAGAAREEALILDLDRTPALGIRRSIRPHSLPVAAHDFLSPRPRIAYFFEPMTRVPHAA